MTNELRKQKVAQNLRENLIRRKNIVKSQNNKEVPNESQSNDKQNDDEKI